MSYHALNSIRKSFFTLNKQINLRKHRFNRLNTLAIRLLLFSMTLCTLTQITGCGNITVRAGYKPNLTALEKTLIQGVSTEQDVAKALGTPVGKGREMLPFMDKPRDSWTYYYEEGDLTDDRRLFLFVFFANQRYDGYMWFSSLPDYKPKLGRKVIF
jgi:hypothetical protein